MADTFYLCHIPGLNDQLPLTIMQSKESRNANAQPAREAQEPLDALYGVVDVVPTERNLMGLGVVGGGERSGKGRDRGI